MPDRPALIAIPGSERTPARGAVRTADADLNESLMVTIRVRRRPDGPPMPSLDELAKIPLNQRKFLSREEFAARHGASPQDFAAVASFAAQNGLTVSEQSVGARTVKLTGTVAQMNAAFGVNLGRYESPTESYRGREGTVYVPSTLGGIVESVLGLDNRRAVRPHFAASRGQATGAPTPHNPPPAGASALTPPQVANLYNFPTNNADGQTIGILEFGGGYAKSDITKFLQSLIPPIATPAIIDQSVDNGTNSPAGSATNVPAFASNPDTEVALDIDVVASVAVGAKIIVYFAPNNDQAFADAVSQAVHDTAYSPTIVTCSWGGSEDGWTGSARSSMVTALNDAALLGVTVFFTSGDDGADDGVGNGKAHIDYPGAEYGGICCGGTYIANVVGSTFTEGTWNDIGTTGGGVSDVYGLPGWQETIGVPKSANDGTTIGRGVPDISGNASPFSGYDLILYGTQTTSLATTSGPQAGFTYGTIAGTSAVAPLYASLLALIEANIGEPLGYLTPLLYALQNDGPFVDINDGANNEWTNPPSQTPPYPTTPFYTCVKGWDACTGLGRIDGGALLSAFQQVFAKAVSFKIDQSTFSQDEVELQLPGTATFPGSYWVAVDGFRPSDLGINAGNLSNPPNSSIPKVSAGFNSSLPNTVSSALQSMLGAGTFAPPVVPQDPNLPNVPQRFLFPFTVSFNGDGGFLAMKAASPAIENTLVDLTATFTGAGSNLSGGSQLELTTGEDPRFEDIDPQTPTQASWLSFDLRFFKMTVPQGQSASRFNSTVTSASDAPAFIANVIGQLNAGLTGSDNFAGLQTDEDASALEFNQQDDSGNYVYNFAVARVRLKAKSAATAKTVRVFFRLFQAQNTVSDFNPSSTYRYWSDGVAFGTAIPLAGVQADQNGNLEYVTIPCFATERITLADPTKSMADQRDLPNAYNLATDPGQEKDYYFGCWIDNNQTVGVLPSSLPNSGLPAAGKSAQAFDGPWGSGVTLGSMKAAMKAFPHQCLIAEIRYDDAPIPLGATSASSDKLAQRNIAWIDGPNPGFAPSRRMMHPVQVRPTPPGSPSPDELMILWGSTPPDSQAQLYLPALDAEAMIAKAQDLYPVQTLGLVDPNTVSCATRGVTFLPLPEGTALAAGLLSIDLPAGIKKGDSYSIIVRQLTGASAPLPPPPPPPPPTPQAAGGSASQAVIVKLPNQMIWQRVAGAFTFKINISTKQELLLAEERLLAVLRWMLSVTSPSQRWYPVLLRYIGDVAGRVSGFGGDPTKIGPSALGNVPGLSFIPGQQGVPERPTHRGDRLKTTGKIDGVIHDHFGDFSGFILETEFAHYHHYETHERRMQEVVERAWHERIRVTVISEPHRPHLPLEVILRSGGR
jgi:Pro-kumamolisin, activation domain/Subtilase family